MARTYSDPSYGARRTISFPTQDISTTTNAGEAALTATRMLYPCTVVGFNVVSMAVCTDLTNATGWVLSHRTSGATGCTAFGTADMLGATCTMGEGEVVDGTLTAAQAFNAGDDCVLEVEGTPGVAGEFIVNLEVIEDFQEADS